MEDDRDDPRSDTACTLRTFNGRGDPCCTVREALRGISRDARSAGISELGRGDAQVDPSCVTDGAGERFDRSDDPRSTIREELPGIWRDAGCAGSSELRRRDW